MECIVHYGDQRYYSVVKNLSAIITEQINLAQEMKYKLVVHRITINMIRSQAS